MTARASSRPARHRRREVPPPRDVCLPSFQARQRGVPVGRVRHHHERHFARRGALAAASCAGGLGARRSNPPRLRPPSCGSAAATARRRGPRPRPSSASSSNFSSEPRRAIDVCVRIADLREALWHREYGKVGRLAVGNLVPVKRRGNPGIGNRAHRIRRARRPILRILVVVEEHAVTLFFPPLRAGQGGRAPLDCARQRERRAAHLVERSSVGSIRTLTCIPREPLVFGQPRSPISSRSDFTSRATRRTSAQLTPGPGSRSTRNSSGWSRSHGAYRVRMQLDAAQVDDPREPRRIIDHDLFGSASRRERQRYCSQPREALRGRALLIERLTFGAVNEALENHRTIPDSGQSARRDRQIIADEVEFRDLVCFEK